MFEIKNIQIKNFKNISFLEFSPAYNTASIISGKNGAGKSSIIDAIIASIGGPMKFKKQGIGTLVKNGENGSTLSLELQDFKNGKTLKIDRKINDDNTTTLKATLDGDKLKQSDLDRILANCFFEPISLQEMRPKEQTEYLLSLLKIDTTELDKFEEEVTQKIKIREEDRDRLSHQYDSIEVIEEMNSTTSLEELEKVKKEYEEENVRINAHNNEVYKNKLLKEQKVEKQAMLRTQYARNKAEIEQLQARIAELERNQESIVLDGNILKEELENIVVGETKELVSISEIEEEIKNTRLLQERVSENNKNIEKRKSIACTISELDNELLKHTTAKKETRKKINSLLQSHGIEGLVLDPINGIEYNGIHFNNLNTAKQIEVTMNLVAKSNPEIRVLYIKDGSLLDEASLEEVSKIAEKHNFQLLIEVVGERQGDNTITLSEGKII